jgi:hypothetical protein
MAAFTAIMETIDGALIIKISELILKMGSTALTKGNGSI